MYIEYIREVINKFYAHSWLNIYVTVYRNLGTKKLLAVVDTPNDYAVGREN